MPEARVRLRGGDSGSARVRRTMCCWRARLRIGCIGWPRARCTTCCWSVILPRASYLVAFIFILFLRHLSVLGELEDWFSGFKIVFCADVCCVFAFLASSALACGLLMLYPWRGFHVFVISMAFVVSWSAAVRICLMHRLSLVHIRSGFVAFGDSDGGDDQESLELVGANGLFLSLAWLPVGFVRVITETLWCPWRVLVGVPRLLCFGSGPLRTMPWWQFREALVGSVFFCSLSLCRRIQLRTRLIIDVRSQRIMQFVAVVMVFCNIAMAFYLTSPPAVRFWIYAMQTFVSFGNKVLCRNESELCLEQWLSLVVVFWMFWRAVFILISKRLDQQRARRKTEERLQHALAHPFYADLEQGFGHLQAFPPSRLDDTGFGLEPLNNLRKKHRNLVAARRETLKHRVGGAAVLPSKLSLLVARERILEQSLRILLERPIAELLAPSLHVTYEGEDAIDAGGCTRDWFSAVAQALAQGVQEDSGASLFTSAPDLTLLPRPRGHGADGTTQTGTQHLDLLAVGRFLALAVFHQQPLPLSFSLVACKHLLHESVDMDDVRSLDPEFFRGRVECILQEGGVSNMVAALGEPLTFMSASTASRPFPQELKPQGSEVNVTEENKLEYIQLLCESYLCGGIRCELQCLLQGFWDLLPLDVLKQSGVSPRELSVLISGAHCLDPDDWQRHSETGHTEIHNWFWELVHELTEEQRCLLLNFATGSSRLPPDGFVALKPRFSVTVSDSGSTAHLPHAHTCTNQIVLYKYESKIQLQARLLIALSTKEFGLL